MAEDWAKTIAKKVAGRLGEEAERTATRKQRFDQGVERFRKQVLDLVDAVNGNIETEAGRIQRIVLDNGMILAAAYKRIVTVEEIGATEGVPASVGKIVVNREDRRASEPQELEEFFVTSSGTQITFYKRPQGGQLKIVSDLDFKQVIEYFAS
jgi:hypothetical protein